MLLGAWTTLENNPYNILDIGSGTGIVALMLAQRSHAENIANSLYTQKVIQLD